MLSHMQDVLPRDGFDEICRERLDTKSPSIGRQELDLVRGAIGVNEDDSSHISGDQPMRWQILPQRRKVEFTK